VAKKGCLGCSLPVFIGILVVFTALVVVSLISGALGSSLFGDVGLPDWFTVPQPHPELPAEVIFHLFGFPITNSIIASWLTVIVLVLLSYAVGRRLKLVPGRLQVLVESVLGWLYDFCREVAGEENGRRFFPVVATIFLFVIMNAWLSLVPGFGSIIVRSHGHEMHLLRGSSTDINIPLALALVSFIFTLFFGFKAHGAFGYLSQYFNVGRFFRGVGRLFKGRLKADYSTLMIQKAEF